MYFLSGSNDFGLKAISNASIGLVVISLSWLEVNLYREDRLKGSGVFILLYRYNIQVNASSP